MACKSSDAGVIYIPCGRRKARHMLNEQRRREGDMSMQAHGAGTDQGRKYASRPRSVRSAAEHFWTDVRRVWSTIGSGPDALPNLSWTRWTNFENRVRADLGDGGASDVDPA